jgi:hypothetical protein
MDKHKQDTAAAPGSLPADAAMTMPSGTPKAQVFAAATK